MINYDEKMVLNIRLVIKMGIDQMGKKFVKSMSQKIQVLRTIHTGFENPYPAVKHFWQETPQLIVLNSM